MGMQNQRKVYGETLVELGTADPRVVALEADLGKSTMSCFFQQRFPNRYFEMGIAEANMVSFAAGLAICGKIPYVNSFAVFAAGRPYDQIRQSVATARLKVRIGGSSSGLSDFGDGATHQAVEDVAIMRAIPSMTVLAPADGDETRQLMMASLDIDGPVYMRLNRNDLPAVTEGCGGAKIGEARILRDGADVVIFCHGVMVARALQAAQTLDGVGISARVVNVSTLKPVNNEQIAGLAQGMKAVVTAEEHSIIGGLASIVAFALRGMPVAQESVAIMDTFGQSAASYDQLLEHYGLTAAAVERAVYKALGIEKSF